jgi:hypothetical protein
MAGSGSTEATSGFGDRHAKPESRRERTSGGEIEYPLQYRPTDEDDSHESSVSHAALELYAECFESWHAGEIRVADNGHDWIVPCPVIALLIENLTGESVDPSGRSGESKHALHSRQHDRLFDDPLGDVDVLADDGDVSSAIAKRTRDPGRLDTRSSVVRRRTPKAARTISS